MSANHRGFFKRNSARLGSNRTLDTGEDVGNRKPFEEARIPADDVGNHLESVNLSSFVHDSVGNSVDEEPCHMKSGILACLVPKASGSRSKGRQREKARPSPVHDDQGASHELSRRPLPKPDKTPLDQNDVKAHKPLDGADDGEYIQKLSEEFSKLLREGNGMPFSFSMKVYRDTQKISDKREQQEIESILQLIETILHNTAIEAEVSYVRYRTAQHRFIVFMVQPALRDPQGNKTLISALRQIVKRHEGRHGLIDMNILIILANAQNIIEGQMIKIGAQKIN